MANSLAALCEVDIESIARFTLGTAILRTLVRHGDQSFEQQIPCSPIVETKNDRVIPIVDKIT